MVVAIMGIFRYGCCCSLFVFCVLLVGCASPVHAGIEDLLFDLTPSSKFVPFEAKNWERFPDTRAAMIKKDALKFEMFTKATIHSLDVMRKAIRMQQSLERMKVTGLIDPLADPDQGENQKGAYYVQSILESKIDAL